MSTKRHTQRVRREAERRGLKLKGDADMLRRATALAGMIEPDMVRMSPGLEEMARAMNERNNGDDNA